MSKETLPQSIEDIKLYYNTRKNTVFNTAKVIRSILTTSGVAQEISLCALDILNLCVDKADGETNAYIQIADIYSLALLHKNPDVAMTARCLFEDTMMTFNKVIAITALIKRLQQEIYRKDDQCIFDQFLIKDQDEVVEVTEIMGTLAGFKGVIFNSFDEQTKVTFQNHPENFYNGVTSYLVYEQRIETTRHIVRMIRGMLDASSVQTFDRTEWAFSIMCASLMHQCFSVHLVAAAFLDKISRQHENHCPEYQDRFEQALLGVFDKLRLKLHT